MGGSRKLLHHFFMSLVVMFLCCIILVFGIMRRETAETRCIESEQHALLQLKNGFVDEYGMISSWGRNSKDCCAWEGVGCSNKTDHVIMLDLHGYWSYDLDVAVGLSGAIDPSLLELPHLKHLDFSYNSFTLIPEFIGSIKNLHYLNLSNMGFGVSQVPPQLGNLSYLQVLDLSGSIDTMKNTDWIYKLSLLEYVSLSYIDLSNSNNLLENMIKKLPSLAVLMLDSCQLPESYVNLALPLTNLSKSLSIIDISDNNLLSSSIYPWLVNFSGSLTNIDLSHNMINTFPEDFSAFTFLLNLDLTENRIKGNIPRSFGNFSNLLSLYFGGNNLKENLPSFFHQLAPTKKSLQILDLGSNEISGSLPDLTTFTSLLELHLEYNEINGSFPENFDQTSNLIFLDLRDNQINGFLPDISAFSSLRELYFERNRLKGNLGERIMPLFELQSLGVSSNLFHGTITERHLTNLSNLVYLDLSYNSLVFEIGSNWSSSFSPDVMSLSSCKLGPSFPTWLQTQKKFSILDISNAQINDSVPDWFWKQLTPTLRYLNLSSNQIYGIVPEFMYGDELYLDLSSNNFWGPVPFFPFDTNVLFLNNNMFSGSLAFLQKLTYLYNLDISNNQMSGELPDFWMNLSQLSIINLEYNNFVGKIPESIGYLDSVIMLSMRGNSLTGKLPSSLRNCTILQFLDLGENKLSGHIPASIWKSLLQLRILSLTSNGFHGTMPTSFCSFSQLKILDISLNNISGNIPRCLINLKGMRAGKTIDPFMDINAAGLSRTRLALSRFRYEFKELLQWKGKKYMYSRTLGLVTSLDLSSNMFNGKIPTEITNLTGLVGLNLSRNNLTSQIPRDIGKLRWLDFLDVSRNHLAGDIPASVSLLTNIGFLDLSYNNLSGRIPTSTQLQSFSASSYTGNPALCGIPLPNACPGDFVTQNPHTTLETNIDVLYQDKLITRGFFVSLSIGLAFGFWGVFGTLAVSDSWRFAYFQFLRHAVDWIIVMITVNYRKLQRRS